MEERESEINFFFFFTILLQCNSTCRIAFDSIAKKNLQFLGLQFSDVDGFGAWNAKFPLDLALAFPNPNALIVCLMFPRGFQLA